MNNPEPKSVFILSGISCTGKSCFLEDSRVRGCKGLRSFNKFLLDVRFGYDKNTFDFLIMNTFMQAYQCQDYDRDEFNNHTVVVERSILDPYFYLLHIDRYVQSQSEVDDMNHMIKLYFYLLTNDGTKPIKIIRFINLDKDWITKSLNEEWTRKTAFPTVEGYLNQQDDYHTWFTKKLDELGIKYELDEIVIHDISKDWTPEMRRSYIESNVVNK